MCVAIAAGFTVNSFSSCSSLPLYKTVITENKIIVPVSLFAIHEYAIIRPGNYDHDIGLRKENEGKYTALLLRCTHADNQLISTGNGFVCNLHGSRFDKEGGVIKGPAELPLKKFSTEIISGNILIHLN